MDRAHSAACTRMCSQPNPAADADPLGGMPKGRNALGRILFGDFLLSEQEKVTRSPAGRVEALALKSQREKLDSSLRWNDEQRRREALRPTYA